MNASPNILENEQNKWKIYRQGTIEGFYDIPLKISWHLTYMCPYNCSYCVGRFPPGSQQNPSWDNLQAAVSHIAAENRPSYFFTFAGGEPTLHPDLPRLFALLNETFADRLGRISITSNGYKPAEYYVQLANIQNIPLAINISIHSERAKIEHIADLVQKVSPLLRLTFFLMYLPSKREYVHEIFDKLCELRKKYAFDVSIVKILDPSNFQKDYDGYIQSDFDYIKQSRDRFHTISRDSGLYINYRGRGEYNQIWDIAENNEHTIYYEEDILLKENIYSFKDMYCATGGHMLVIKTNGACEGAACALASRSTLNIFERSPYEEDSFVRYVHCKHDLCACSMNYSLPKFRNEVEARLFIHNLRGRLKRNRL